MNLLEYLKQNPEARERKNKNKVVAKLVWEHYGMDMGVGKGKMADIVGDILNLDRKWRLILKENPELRGSDYGEEDGTKDKLEVEKQRELGYPV